jgi:hypothetical protein
LVSDKDRLVQTYDDKLEPKAIRRLELITGTGRPRAWSHEDKARMVEERWRQARSFLHLAPAGLAFDARQQAAFVPRAVRPISRSGICRLIRQVLEHEKRRREFRPRAEKPDVLVSLASSRLSASTRLP